MEALAIAAGVLIVLVLPWGRRPPRYTHWRGPTTGARDDVQREHGELFYPPARGHDDGEEAS